MEREAKLGDLIPLMPETFNDYRDVFPLVYLCTSGYLDHTWTMSDGPIDDLHTLASIFYAKAKGLKSVGQYQNTRGEKDLTLKFRATAKADFYFAELRSKRLDRVITMVTSVVVGVASATLALMIKISLT